MTLLLSHKKCLISNGFNKLSQGPSLFGLCHLYNLWFSFLFFRIKGWWVFHHYISTFLSGVMLTWWVISHYLFQTSYLNCHLLSFTCYFLVWCTFEWNWIVNCKVCIKVKWRSHTFQKPIQPKWHQWKKTDIASYYIFIKY